MPPEHSQPNMNLYDMRSTVGAAVDGSDLEGLKNGNYDRDLNEYTKLLSTAEEPFDIHDWKGKVLLDIGSGGKARFATGAEKQGAHVISLNPALVDDSHRASLKQGVEEANSQWAAEKADLKEDYRQRFGKLIGSVALRRRMRGISETLVAPSVAGLAQQLPFRDDSFDGIVSVYGSPYYLHHVDEAYTEETRARDKVLISQAFDEVVRVLKPGGKAYLRDRHLAHGKVDDFTKKNVYSKSDGTETDEIIQELSGKGIHIEVTESKPLGGAVERLIVVSKPNL